MGKNASQKHKVMKPGIHKDLTIEDYHEDRTIISSTGLKQAKKSTRNFAHYVLFGSESKSHFDFGNAFELAVMDKVNGTDFFDQNVAVMPTNDWITEALNEKPDLKVPASSKAYKDAKKAWEAENEGKYTIKDIGETESKVALDAMVDSCVNNEIIYRLLSGTEYQVSLVWKDEELGIMCKTRPDVCKAKKNVIVDIKTCKDASPHGFARDAANLDYPLQAIMQIEGAKETGLIDEIDAYYWLADEKTPPYNVALYEFQKEDIEFFYDAYRVYLTRCAKGLQSIKDLKEPDLSRIASYGENSDNKYGILPLEIPLWYRGN